MNNYTSKVIDNLPLGAGCFLMRLECQLSDWRPGQFVMLQVNSSMDPFLRRPFGILAAGGGVLEIFYRLKGDGTLAMSKATRGDVVEVLGPLGNGFSVAASASEHILIAGGTGLPPIWSLAQSLDACRLIVGARTAADMPLRERLEQMDGVEMVTEDGSLGRKGLVTDLIGDQIGAAQIYACGPTPMLRAISAKVGRVPCQVSLEERMGCGFGVCSGCVVMTVDGNKRVCKEGPVFDAAQIVWS